jgi:hypothetical protein
VLVPLHGCSLFGAGECPLGWREGRNWWYLGLCQFSRTLDLLFLIGFKKRIAERQGLRAVGEGGKSGEGEAGVGRVSNMMAILPYQSL